MHNGRLSSVGEPAERRLRRLRSSHNAPKVTMTSAAAPPAAPPIVAPILPEWPGVTDEVGIGGIPTDANVVDVEGAAFTILVNVEDVTVTLTATA